MNNNTSTRYEVRKAYKHIEGELTIAKFENQEEATTYAELWRKGSGETNEVRVYKVTEEVIFETQKEEEGE